MLNWEHRAKKNYEAWDKERKLKRKVLAALKRSDKRNEFLLKQLEAKQEELNVYTKEVFRLADLNRGNRMRADELQAALIKIIEEA